MVSTVRSTPFLMSSKWFGSTETVGSSTKRCSSDSYSSRCELAKDKRLSRFNVVDIQILRRVVVRDRGNNKAYRSYMSYRTYCIALIPPGSHPCLGWGQYRTR